MTISEPQEKIRVEYIDDRPVVSARELHEVLGIHTIFRQWFPRMCEYGFMEGLDYTKIYQKKEGSRVPRHFEVAAYCKITANYFLYFTDDTYKSVLFTTACSFLFYQSNRLDKGGVPGVREAQGRNRLCSRLD